MAEPKELPESLPSRRNLPRASHACQRCRVKKAKCDQRQPCANCIKHLHECTYGLRRRSERTVRSTLRPGRRESGSTDYPSPSLPSAQDSQREIRRSGGSLEHTHGSDRLGIFTFTFLRRKFVLVRNATDLGPKFLLHSLYLSTMQM